MIKIEFFFGSSCYNIQTGVNAFLKGEVEYIDIKFITGKGQMGYVCILVYKDIKESKFFGKPVSTSGTIIV